VETPLLHYRLGSVDLLEELALFLLSLIEGNRNIVIMHPCLHVLDLCIQFLVDLSLILVTL
jgi:hypothetical protein